MSRFFFFFLVFSLRHFCTCGSHPFSCYPLILELFEVFDQNPILWCKEGVAIAVLSAYTWSFLQFTLVFTATADTVPDTEQLAKVTMSFKINTVK